MMLNSKIPEAHSALQTLPLKMPKVPALGKLKLVKRKDEARKLSPSEYAHEMSQTTEERLTNTHEVYLPRIVELLDMSEASHHKISAIDMDHPFFQPYPSEIVFQNYLPSETYEVPLMLHNADKIPRLVKVVKEDSLCFKVVSPVDVCNKVAPGMTSTFTVLFTPLENKDYIHRVIFMTEREKFEVPIRAIGPRAILDFPDEIHFPLCPVKCLSEKTLLVRNIGKDSAKFQLNTQKPFSVEPSVGTLSVGDSMQVTIYFLSTTNGDHSQQLHLYYHTGEDIYINLYGASTDINVRLDRNSLWVEKTYITMANQRTVAILNRSDTIVHFQWKREVEEEQHRKRFISELQQEEDDEMEQFLTECGADPTLRDRILELSHTFQYRRKQIHQDSLASSDQHIIIEPQEGDIWPNCTAEINIIFKPQEARLYQHTVYCDVTGRKTCLPLRIKGEGMGPKLQFNFYQLDIGNVFVGSKHSYEVLVSNNGLIDAPYRLMPPTTAMGLCFSFSPPEGTVLPGACHVLEVCFCSDKLGTFSEEFYFTVFGTPQPLVLTFRGCVIGPTFHFNIPKLDFGEISFGFPQTLTCSLINTSLVSMSFALRIPGDGMGRDSVTSTEQVKKLDRNNWNPGDRASEGPREFRVTPSSGTIRALSQINIKVTLCSNTVQQYSLAMIVDVKGAGEELLALPIKASCVVPEVQLQSSVFQFQHCFLSYPYEQTIRLINDTNLPACYGLLAQEYEENPPLLYSSVHPRGVIQPYSAEQIPLVLQAKTVGQVQVSAYIAILGHQEPPLEVLLSCIGQGPVVSLSVTELQFGTIPVLTDVPRTLQMFNQSPIPARFLAKLAKSNTRWRVEPAEGEIPPDGQLELTLVAYLDDALPFQDKLQLAIHSSQTHTVLLWATGKGTTIVTDRPFAPNLDLGIHFSSGPCQYHFRITNKGQRIHKLYWTTEGFPRSCRRGPPTTKHQPVTIPRESKAKSPLSPSSLGAPVFSLTPTWLELGPGHSADMLLEGSCDTPKVIRERLVCHAIVGNQNGKERIITVDITCRFIAPVLDISPQQLNFCVEKVADMPLEPLYKKLYLKNVSMLALCLELALVEPFGLCDSTLDDSFICSKSLVMGVGAEAEMWVRFNPSYQLDLVSRVAEEVLEVSYSGHPHRDTVTLRGEVHFPNLHFSSHVLDFGCILNCTEVQHQLTMTNYSPLPVIYRWAFRLDKQHYCIWQGRISESQQEEEGGRDPNPDAKDHRETEELVSTSGLDILGTEGQLTCSSISLGQISKTSTAQMPTGLGKDISTTSLIDKDTPNINVEDIFGILPLSGVLQPGEIQQVTFFFFGHADISAQVLAMCEVEEGPTYEITLKGEASLITYSLDTTEIILGPQLFDHVAEAEIILRNTGKVGFDFNFLLENQHVSPKDALPGQPLVIPNMGHLRATEEMKVSVYYLPGIPEVFEKLFQLQVAFFEPENITIRGEGIFPRVSLDLPRELNKEQYSPVLKKAKEAVGSESPEDDMLSWPGSGFGEMCEEDHISTYDALLQMEVERLLVKENAIVTELSLSNSVQSETTGSISSMWPKKLSRFILPEYLLDFGYVIPGTVSTRIVKVKNTGPLPVSFRAEKLSLAGTGFSTELDRVKNMPCCETETFEIKFNPQGANQELGEITTILPILVFGGPTVQVRLCAVVAMPSLSASTNMLQFDAVYCGLCEVATMRLHNPQQVPCKWNIKKEKQPKKKVDKHIPLHLRQKACLEKLTSPLIFEMSPSSGMLYPGNWVNILVKFSPAEGKMYKERFVIAVAQSTQWIQLLAQGQGLEPQLDFSTTEIGLGPVLPYSNGEEVEVVVRNPCCFPIEFYSLDFDRQYLEEEVILQVIKGYDVRNALLLPPRAPGEPLPAELLDYYQEHMSQNPDPASNTGFREDVQSSEKETCAGKVDNVSNASAEEETSAEKATSALSKYWTFLDIVNNNRKSRMGDLQVDPVSRAIAHYLGIDMSPAGQADFNTRGIAIVVHGAPLSGKTDLAVSLARYYGAAYLNIDSVVQEAVSSGTSNASEQVRKLVIAYMESVQVIAPDEMTVVSQDVGSLSVEELVEHTAEGIQDPDPKSPTSTILTNNQTSTKMGAKKNGGSNTIALMSGLTCGQVGDLEGLNSLLTDDLLGEILSERLQLSDCSRGVVIDGLETQYCRFPSTALHVLIKAFKNRQHIYVINLTDSYLDFKSRERVQLEMAEALEREQIERERQLVQEMDLNEYDDLCEEDKAPPVNADVQQLEVRDEQMYSQQESNLEERQQEEKLGEEEDIKKKNKREKKGAIAEDSTDKRSQLGVGQSDLADTEQKQLAKEERKMPSCIEAKDSFSEDRRLDEDDKDNMPTGYDHSLLTLDELEEELITEAERQLFSRFRLYEQSQPQIQHILLNWDKTQSLLLNSFPSEEEQQGHEETPEPQKLHGKRSKKEQEKEKMKTDITDPKLLSSTPSQTHLLPNGTEGSEKELAIELIPYICIPISNKEEASIDNLLSSMKLPSVEEVLDLLGLGPTGPPIPPPVLFSVVPYPKRKVVSSSHFSSGCFTFLMPSPPEDSAEEKREAEVETEASSPTVSAKEDATTLNKSKGKKAPVKKESAKGTPKDKQRVPAKKGGKIPEAHVPRVNTATPLPETDHSKPLEDCPTEHSQRLTNFRWVVPANGEVTVKLWFYSSVSGDFKQTLGFEVMGTKRNYQLFCRGICAFPSISNDYKTVFAHCKKAMLKKNNLQKTYIIRPSLYDFGPLLCGTAKDRYKKMTQPENAERLVIHNSSPMEAEVYFCLHRDSKSTTFILDPLSMVLKPNEQKELGVWAYPTTPGVIEDNVVCCIKDNPEPSIFHLSCKGVRPELVVERKQLSFDKIFLGRRESRSLCLRNPTPLPVSWRLSGLEVLGKEFSISQDHGIIMPHSEFSVLMHFKAQKPFSLKKTIRIEVSDVDNILGVVHTESVNIVAEAYDVALEISFPKGTDNSLDFGIIKVSEEVKLSVNLKNKGKHDISYKFVLEPTESGMPNPNSVFTITPQKGSLRPTERPACVQVFFCYNKEVSIRQQPILHCQVIEPNVHEDKETMKIVPIKVSVQCVYSKYSIHPANNINFGPVVHSSHTIQTITVENRGEFEICFTISRFFKDLSVPEQERGIVKSNSARRLSSAIKLRQPNSIQKDTIRDTMPSQTRLPMGLFSLSPCFGVLPPGGQQVVTVEFVAEHVGCWEERLLVDISDRDPSDSPGGIVFKLLAEVCLPGIANDIASIFEEHRLCKNSNMLQCEQYQEAMGIYIQDETKFIFNNVLVSQSAKARFRLTNPGKIPCKLSLQVKSVTNKMSVRSSEVFKLNPTRMSISSNSHAFATVTFTPQNMQTYLGVFEACLKGTTASKLLVFDLVGEGNLPCIAVLKPVQRSKHGQPVLQFKRLLVEKRQVLPLVIKNISKVPAQVSIDLLDKIGVFALRATPGTVCNHISSSHIASEPETEERQMAHLVSLTLMAGQQAEFEVEFQPVITQSFEAIMQLSVKDNPYEKTLMQLQGEGYSDIISLDSISSKIPQDQASTEARCDIVHFGDCHVGRLYHKNFTMTNNSNSEVLRFQWPQSEPHLYFSPQIGHLHAKCTKEVTVSFSSEQPIVLTAQVIKCKLCQITFQQPVDQVPDWDDRHQIVKWVDVDKPLSPQRPSKKKVVETDPEPIHSVVENSFRELELRINAMCDYAKFECDVIPIQFKDTMLFQTTVFQMQMDNKGTVEIEYSWQVIMENSMNSQCFNQKEDSQSALRPATNLRSLSTLLLGDLQLLPFTVEPSMGLMLPGTNQIFHVCFSPLEVAHYEARLVCSIPNLKDKQGPVIAVNGSSIMPYCHFHLEDSEYLNDTRQNLELPGLQGSIPRIIQDPNTKVIEFKSTGVGTSICRTFSVVNPTNKPYSFLWRCEDSEVKPFTCLTPKDSIQSGKKVEVSFKYHAQKMDLVESFWMFLIPEHKFSVPFLLVGTAKDPVVYIDYAHLNFGSLLIGHEAHKIVHVVNREDQPFHFAIEEASLHSESIKDRLMLKPMKGTVPPKEKFPVALSFTPMQEGLVTFNLCMMIRGKVQPLSMNVKADCYNMNVCVQYESPKGALTKLSAADRHLVDFKQVELGGKSTCAFVVFNPGTFDVDVQYEITGPEELHCQLQVEPAAAVVPVGKQNRCILSFSPLKTCDLKDMGFLVKVKDGPVFHCTLLGSSTSLDLEFSFLKYNFEKTFIYTAGMVPATCTLLISNKGNRAISVDCLFFNTPFLEMGFMPDVLPPSGSMEVPITFYPREATCYHEKLVFKINKCSRQVVEIMGQGIVMKLDVENPQLKTVKLGTLQVSQKSKKLIPLINNSLSSLTFSLVFTPSAQTLLNSKVLSVNPCREVTLKGGGGKCVVEVLFSPQQRMAPFSEEVQLKCLGAMRPLLVMKGCCQGVEVTLDQNYLSFGAVAQHCQATRRIMLQNRGDIGARFKWDVKAFAPDFSICPAEGYICPAMEVSLVVTFAPKEVKQELCYDNLLCSIEAGKPVNLTLAGSCIALPVSNQVMNFVCQVRSHCTQSVTLSNNTNQRWHLRPVIEGEYWSALLSFVLEPYQQNKAYEITYKPMAMTTDGKKHLGSVFFSFPDGSGMLYTLQGTAEPPKAVSTISREVPCKTSYIEIVPVHNWLPKPQRFRAIVEMIKPERPDSTVSLKGFDYVDVSALSKGDYKISFFSYKECQCIAKLTFKNETTGEYQFYYLNFKATPPGVISTIEMVTVVRQVTSGCVKVENPLPTNLLFTAECRSMEVSVQPQFSVPALTTETLRFEYQPLHYGETTARLMLYNNELGYFHYELLLRALLAPPEKPLYFSAPLGSGQYLMAKFTSHSRVKTEYTCKTDHPDFIVDKNVIPVTASSQAGTDVSVEVYFEPCQLGEVRSLLTVSSSTGGDYVFPLYGTCTHPKAQGPMVICAGSHISIHFKNVFMETTAFSCQVDNPAFTIKGMDTIRSKKTNQILVSFENPQPGSKTPCTGKLTISSPRTGGHGHGLSWVYYLKGISPEQPQREKI